MKWTEAYEFTGPILAVPVKLIRVLGAKEAILFSQLFYWNGKQRDADGWIYKTKAELEDETGLSEYEQDKSTDDLKKRKVLQTRYDRLEHRLYYRICKDGLNALMEEHPPGEPKKLEFGNLKKHRSRTKEKRVRLKEHKITTENTTTTLYAQPKDGVQTSKEVIVVSSLLLRKGSTSSGVGTPPAESAPSLKIVPNGALSEESDARDVLDVLVERYGLNTKQSAAIAEWAANNGLGYLIQKDEIVRSEPRDNLAKAFIAAVRDDWQPRKSSAPKKGKKVSDPIPKSQPPTDEEWQARKEALSALKSNIRGGVQISVEASAKFSGKNGRFNGR